MRYTFIIISNTIHTIYVYIYISSQIVLLSTKDNNNNVFLY